MLLGKEYYIGMMSGTSIDGIDAVLVELDNKNITLMGQYSAAIPDTIRDAILRLTQPGHDEINQLLELDARLGELFANTVIQLCQQTRVAAREVKAIGHHGQTIRHRPTPPYANTLQIGDPNYIAEFTGITTVADFRRRNIAQGGQGAPLLPAFHSHVFRDPQQMRAIVNIGGISNVTILIPGENTFGFDTGPGNMLMDLWCKKHKGTSYDNNGDFAASGNIYQPLLADLLAHPYFNMPPPKSTGRELFHEEWLNTYLENHPALPPADVQATLTAFTTRSIQQAILKYAPQITEVYLCGGGAFNQHLVKEIRHLLEPRQVDSTQALGIPPQLVEAIAFAWFAKQTLHQQSVDLMDTTGSDRPTLLGGIYFASGQ